MFSLITNQQKNTFILSTIAYQQSKQCSSNQTMLVVGHARQQRRQPNEMTLHATSVVRESLALGCYGPVWFTSQPSQVCTSQPGFIYSGSIHVRGGCLVAWLCVAQTYAAGVWFLILASDSNCEGAGTMFGCPHKSWQSYHFV